MNVTEIILPVLSLFFGVIASVYLFAWWTANRREPHAPAVLYWASGLFLLYWYQIPAILLGFGERIALNDFVIFLALAYPLSFLAHVILFLGILRLYEVRLRPTARWAIGAWLIIAFAYFFYAIVIDQGGTSSILWPIGGLFAFFVIIRILVIRAVVGLRHRPALESRMGQMGSWIVITEAAFGLVRAGFLIVRMLQFPTQYWAVTFGRSQFFFIAQTTSVVLLAVAFYFLHRAYYSKPPRRPSPVVVS